MIIPPSSLSVPSVILLLHCGFASANERDRGWFYVQLCSQIVQVFIPVFFKVNVHQQASVAAAADRPGQVGVQVLLTMSAHTTNTTKSETHVAYKGK